MVSVDHDLEKYKVDGYIPSKTISPKSPESLADLLRIASENRWNVIPFGFGNMMNIGSIPNGYDIALDLNQMPKYIQHNSEDLTVTCSSNTSFGELNLKLQEKQQWLPFDSPLINDQSVGGLLACNLPGSLNACFGYIRDYVIGMKTATPFGQITKSGGTVVKNVTGYDLSKILSGSFGTLTILSEIAIKVLPKPLCNKTLVIDNPHLKKAIEYLNLALSSSSDVSGGAFYPEIFRNYFSLNDLTIKGALTAIRVEGPQNSVDQRIDKLKKELKVNTDEVSVLETQQSNLFWKNTQNLSVFSNIKNNLIRLVVPPSSTFDLLQKMKKYQINYFIDWGGNLIWVEINKINTKILKEINDIVREYQGYLTVIKIEEHLKAQVDIFAIDPIKYKISEKIKKSFDPKRILNPGKMYIGI